MWHRIHQLMIPLLSPKKFTELALRVMPWLSLAFVISLSYGLVAGLVFAPSDTVQGDAFRIIYIHVPAAFLSLFVYGVMAWSAMLWLVFHVKIAPIAIRHSISLGMVFTLIALITGSIWGKPMWGTYWIFDARLTSELILLFLYFGLFVFERAIRTKKRGASLLAALVIIGFVDIPIIHYSVNWWNTLHQGATLSVLSMPKIATSMLLPLLAMIVAFFLFYIIVLMKHITYDMVIAQNVKHWLNKETQRS